MISLKKISENHEKLFPNATLESQVWKLEEEIQEWACSEEGKQRTGEAADIVIVCGGLYRWCPRVSLFIARIFLDNEEVEKEVNRKWKINEKRKWEWNGKTYHHVEE